MQQSAHCTSDGLACLLCLDQLIVESCIEGIADAHRPLRPEFANHQRLACEGNAVALWGCCGNSCFPASAANMLRSSFLDTHQEDIHSKSIMKIHLPPLSCDGILQRLYGS